jgi:dephospho-CoA kinase
MLRVGLTGGIGAGKSTVSRLLAARGAMVIDADRLAHEVVEPGTDGYAALLDEFGPSVLSADGSVNRATLAELVFADEAARRRLETIIHPRVRARAKELEAQADPQAVVVHEIPLLVETSADGFDVVVVVDIAEDEAVRRLLGRGMSADDAWSRIKTQASREQRRAVADVVLDNSGGTDSLSEQVEALWRDLSARAALSPR